MSGAAETIRRLAELQPEVVRLARSVSLAARIEPPLLRRLRIDLLPASDAGLEADLRFSSLTRSHNASSIVLHAEAVEILREQLAQPANRTLLDRAWQILQAQHASAPSIIQLEEKVTWLALRGETSEADLDSELRRALRALSLEDRSGIAQWAARALPRLPPRARKSEAAWLLAVGAAARLGGREILEASAAVDVPHEVLRAILPTETNTARIGVRLLEDGIEFGDIGLPGAKLLRIPNASPVTLDLKWVFDGAAANEAPPQTRAVFSLGSRKKLQWPGDSAAKAGILEILISTTLGEEHLLRPVLVSSALSETAEALLRRFAQPGPKRILAIDSGGIRCTIGLQFLARIEALLRERFQNADLKRPQQRARRYLR